MSEKIRLGISHCLLGAEVRYNGQHKRDRFLTDTLGKYVEYVPVCPEVECGLPVPRESMRLVGDPDAPRLMTRNTGRDLTDQMLGWAAKRVKELEKERLCGFIFKAKSPSSGLERVKVYNGRGGMAGKAPGMFAKVFTDNFPLLPVEEEGRLHDADLRENFIERIFTLNRYREAMECKTVKSLIKFHETNKLLLMAHSEQYCRPMGRAIAGANKTNLAKVSDDYEDNLLKAMKLPATVKKHVNVLEHILGYFKKLISHEEKQEMLEIIENFKIKQVPLIVPVTILNHYVKKYSVEYLMDQYYLNPHPLELKLRNHA